MRMLQKNDYVGWQKVLDIQKIGPYSYAKVQCVGCYASQQMVAVGTLLQGMRLICRPCWWALSRRVGLQKARRARAGMRDKVLLKWKGCAWAEDCPEAEIESSNLCARCAGPVLDFQCVECKAYNYNGGAK